MHKLDAETRRGIGKDKADMMLHYYVDGPNWLQQNKAPRKRQQEIMDMDATTDEWIVWKI